MDAQREQKAKHHRADSATYMGWLGAETVLTEDDYAISDLRRLHQQYRTSNPADLSEMGRYYARLTFEEFMQKKSAEVASAVIKSFCKGATDDDQVPSPALMRRQVRENVERLTRGAAGDV